MANLYGDITESQFSKMAIASIVDWWNTQFDLVEQFGHITTDKVYTTWKCKIIENFKGLFGVDFDGDGLYFEVTYHGAKKKLYLDVYKKQDQWIGEIEYFFESKSA